MKTTVIINIVGYMFLILGWIFSINKIGLDLIALRIALCFFISNLIIFVSQEKKE